jgi:hypothetical protein
MFPSISADVMGRDERRWDTMSFNALFGSVVSGLAGMVEDQAPQLEALAGAIVIALVKAGLQKLQPKQS